MPQTDTDVADDDYYTLLGVRPDGVAPVVDLVAAIAMTEVRDRAKALLDEHASCEIVEVWRSGALVERLGRASADAGTA